MPKTRSAGRALPALILAAAALTGCMTTAGTATDATMVACEAFRPVTFSGAGDTAETVRQVREHNAAWEAVCR